MQERGMVSKEEHRIEALVPRQDLTGPERTWAARYEFNDVVRYARASKETGIERGEYARVKSVDAEKNLLTVVRADGSELTYDPRRQQACLCIGKNHAVSPWATAFSSPHRPTI
jgi:hypothetical protein